MFVSKAYYLVAPIGDPALDLYRCRELVLNQLVQSAVLFKLGSTQPTTRDGASFLYSQNQNKNRPLRANSVQIYHTDGLKIAHRLQVSNAFL